MPLDHMSKKYTLEQLESFVENFAKCFFANASLCFKIVNTRTKNRFHLYLKDEKNNFYCISTTYDNISISLNSHFAQKNPFIMLRDGIIVTIDDLVERFNCDRYFIYMQIFKRLKNDVECFLNHKNKYLLFKAKPIYTNTNFSTYEFSCHAKTFDEFKVQVDLNVK